MKAKSTDDSLDPNSVIALRLVFYFDIFHHPLSSQEIWTLGFNTPLSAEALQHTLDSLVARGILERLETWYFPPGRSAGVARRQLLARRSQQLWRRVPLAVMLLERMPFVRGAVVTGSLAKNAVAEGADIDFLVFTARNRVWICRSLLAVLRKILPGQLRKHLCTNVFLAEDGMSYDQRTLYIAVEIATAIPVSNPALATRFLWENRWITQFLPGVTVTKPADLRLKTSDGPIESPLQGGVGDQLESMLARSWRRYWHLKYSGLSEQELSRRFRVKRTLSTNHYHDFQTRTMQAYAERLARVGLEP